MPNTNTMCVTSFLNDPLRDISRQGRAISGALSYAVERINNCSCLLPDVYLDFIYVDTEGKENKSTQAVVDLICK